jgi:hypothetical protein
MTETARRLLEERNRYKFEAATDLMKINADVALKKSDDSRIESAPRLVEAEKRRLTSVALQGERRDLSNDIAANREFMSRLKI